MSKRRSDNADYNNAELQNLLSTTINSLSNWIHVVDKNLNVMMMNDPLKGMMKSLGFRRNLEKKELGEVFPFLSKKAINDYKKVFKTGKSIVTEEVTEFEGRKIYTESIKEPVFEKDNVVRVITVIRDISTRKQTEKAIIESERQLKVFAAHMQTVREDERIAISRELHDDLGQNLTALRIDIARLIKKLNDLGNLPGINSALGETDEIMPLIDASIQKVRAISRELRPRILDELGLIAAIEWQISEYKKRTGISGSLYSEIQKFNIESHNKIALFRIIQAALINIIQHSEATELSVTIRKRKNSLLFEVKDNGTGINEKEINDPGSIGIMGMKERTALLGGKLAIKGIHGKGTSVQLAVPVKVFRGLN